MTSREFIPRDPIPDERLSIPQHSSAPQAIAPVGTAQEVAAGGAVCPSTVRKSISRKVLFNRRQVMPNPNEGGVPDPGGRNAGQSESPAHVLASNSSADGLHGTGASVQMTSILPMVDEAGSGVGNMGSVAGPFDSEGFDKDGYDSGGFDKDGYDRYGY